MLTLGTVPLGRYLFKAAELTRDFIQVGEQGELWARRSHLRLSGKPLLLTELFCLSLRCMVLIMNCSVVIIGMNDWRDS